MIPYSKDLRLRVLAAVDAGTPREEVAKIFSVSVPTIKRWLKRRRETGDVEPRAIPGRPSRKGAMLKAWLPKHLEANDDLTLEEHSEAFEERVWADGLHLHHWESDSRPARWRMADQKKSQIASERDEEVRGLWRWLASRFDARRLVFVDESGFHTSMTRLYARAPRGKRAYGKVPRNRGKRTLRLSPRSLSKEPWASQ